LSAPPFDTRFETLREENNPMTTEHRQANLERAQRAEKLLIAYAARVNRTDELAGAGTTATLVTDLLADFLHYCHRMEIDLRNCQDTAEMHFDAELEEERA
jgi:hypothetical protein